MPADTNPTGHIFGEWVVSQMDLAGLDIARQYSPCHVVTVSIESMKFIRLIFIGDVVCCYTQLLKTSRTFIAVSIETWAMAQNTKRRRLVTEGVFVYVAVDEHHNLVGLITPQ